MTSSVQTLSALLLAVLLDALLRAPSNALHPVGWMGGAIAAGRRRLLRGGAVRLVVAGAAVTLFVAATAAGAALVVTVAARGRHLVSRDTSTLDAGHVASGAVESVAENLTDAVLAPLCFYLAFGLAGAAAYRAINTADAMLGYREGALEYFGKVAARVDDLLNWPAARLAALSIVVAAFAARGSSRAAYATLRRDGPRTASPNAGRTMAAMAGALGVRLAKPGAYELGDGRPSAWPDIAWAIATVRAASALAIGALIVTKIAIDIAILKW